MRASQAPGGLLPTWVDEASNFGLSDIRNARRMQSTQLDCDGDPGAPVLNCAIEANSSCHQLRLICRNHHRMSQASTGPGRSQSLCDAFDLTCEDSDHDIRAQLDLPHSEGDGTSSLVGVDRSFVVHGDCSPRFILLLGGTKPL